ncbi:hypothetical protein F4861DRAFT_16505 [Xylaria intraflava]|nr:hypothetical protein F4861DRAFT_16505 [Xylaria intraflava]
MFFFFNSILMIPFWFLGSFRRFHHASSSPLFSGNKRARGVGEGGQGKGERGRGRGRQGSGRRGEASGAGVRRIQKSVREGGWQTGSIRGPKKKQIYNPSMKTSGAIISSPGSFTNFIFLPSLPPFLFSSAHFLDMLFPKPPDLVLFGGRGSQTGVGNQTASQTHHATFLNLLQHSPI